MSDTEEEMDTDDRSVDSLSSEDSTELSGDDFSPELTDASDLELEEEDPTNLKYQLIAAARDGSKESMHLVLTENPDVSLLESTDHNGRTLLHNCSNVEVAQCLLKSCSFALRETLLSSQSYSGETVLHTSAQSGNEHLVDYIIRELGPNAETLLFTLDRHKSTALHHARSLGVARRLLDSIPANKKLDFLTTADEFGLTALHQASTHGLCKTIVYLLEQAGSEGQRLLLQTDIYGRNPLAYARNSETAKLLIDRFTDGSTSAYLFQCDYEGKTALRVTVDEGYRLDVVQLLLKEAKSEDQQLLQSVASDGSIALHGVANAETARVLIEALAPSQRHDFIFHADDEGQTAFHRASVFDSEDVIIYLIELVGPEAIKLLTMGDNEGRNALHLASEKQTVRRLLKLFTTALEVSDNYSDELKDGCSYIKMLDNHSDSSLSIALVKNDVQYDTFKYLLKYVDTYGAKKDVKFLLEHRNSAGRNVFHLACISNSIEKLFHVLEYYKDIADVESVVLPDKYGNSPISYIASKYYTKWFVDILMRLPLPLRRQICSVTNTGGLDVQAVVQRKSFDRRFYLESILCEPYDYLQPSKNGVMNSESYYRTPFHNFVYRPGSRQDDAILKVMNYALNYYSILDPGSVISLNLCMNSLNQNIAVPGRYKRGMVAEVSRRIDSAVREDGAALWLFIQNKLEDDLLMTQRLTQQTINSMDKPCYHGKPKVAVVQVKTESAPADGYEDLLRQINFTPPGPDYVIISALMITVPSDKYTCEKWTCGLQESFQQDIDSVLEKLDKDENVLDVVVNSTLGRRYKTSTAADKGANTSVVPEKTSLQIGLHSDLKGVALLLSNSNKRPEWREELNDAKIIAEHFLGLKAIIKNDLSAVEMVEAVSEFSRHPSHGPITCLIVMAHGDTNGNISGNDSSVCSVQSLVDALNIEKTLWTYKILILSFCRGQLGRPKSTRVSNSWEYQQLPAFLPFRETALTSRELEWNELVREWEVNPLPSIYVPADFFICFATLPDSLCRRGMLLRTLKLHLSDWYKYNHNPIESVNENVSDQDMMSGDDVTQSSAIVTGKRNAPDSIGKQEAMEGMIKKRRKTNSIDLVDLITDIAGRVREESGYTIYTNHCYRPGRHVLLTL